MDLAPILESAQGACVDGPQCLVACSQAVPSRYIPVPDNLGCQAHSGDGRQKLGREGPGDAR